MTDSPESWGRPAIGNPSELPPDSRRPSQPHELRRPAASASLAQLATLDAGSPEKLAVLLLGHALTALLDDRAHAESFAVVGG